MNYLSVCSGIEAATVAWHHMGWKPVGFSEIEKFPSNVLAHHYPSVTNYGDMTKFKEWNINDPVELLVGGTPCQSFSVAGLRKGLADPRGNLMLTYLAMADHFKPKWLLWENVPGVLSSNRGADFGALLQGLAQLGYGFAYRVLDAQHFGVPQRRRRVFVVGCLGNWRSAAKVLFESESLCGDITPSRETRKEIANFLTKSPSSYNGFNPASHEGNGVVVPIHARDGKEVLGTLTASYGTGVVDLETKPLVHNVAVDTYNGTITGDVTCTLTADATSASHSGPKAMVAFDAYNNSVTGDVTTEDKTYVAYSFDSLASNSMKSKNPNSGCREVDLSKTLDTTVPCPSKNQGGIGIKQNMRVRRLTPIECERLQGFPDNYTNIPNAPDTGRYKALGNSMAVPVMRWIGERIEAQKM